MSKTTQKYGDVSRYLERKASSFWKNNPKKRKFVIKMSSDVTDDVLEALGEFFLQNENLVRRAIFSRRKLVIYREIPRWYDPFDAY